MTSRVFFLLILFCLAGLSASVDITYHKSSASVYQRSSYMFSWVSSSSHIHAYIRPSYGNPVYKVLLWRPGESAPTNSPFQELEQTGTAEFISNQLDVGGQWRIENLPNS